MGKITILATDIFFCLFAIFAALREVVPHYEFTPPAYSALEVKWAAPSAEYCIIKLGYEIAGLSDFQSLDTEPGYSLEGQCRVTSPVEISNSTESIIVYALVPILADCKEILITLLEMVPVLKSCSENKLMTFEFSS